MKIIIPVSTLYCVTDPDVLTKDEEIMIKTSLALRLADHTTSPIQVDDIQILPDDKED